ncbi:MAG: hypothetical protein AAGA80_19410 [Cyanobacteria bacterium P01_F01_bin.143]
MKILAGHPLDMEVVFANLKQQSLSEIVEQLEKIVEQLEKGQGQ